MITAVRETRWREQSAQLLDLARSTGYYRPEPTSVAELALMRWLDEFHLEHPFAESRILRNLLKREGIAVGRKHVALVRWMQLTDGRAHYFNGAKSVGAFALPQGERDAEGVPSASNAVEYGSRQLVHCGACRHDSGRGT